MHPDLPATPPAAADAAAEPPVPVLVPLARISIDVAAVVRLGEVWGTAERRFVPLAGGTVEGRLQGRVIEGGVDWQWRRADGTLEISAHYALALHDGAIVEVRSDGLRHGPPAVMAALARGEAVPASAYRFRTAVRLHTGAPAWQWLNHTLAVASGAREAGRVHLALYEVR
jgi:hypothetical protein